MIHQLGNRRHYKSDLAEKMLFLEGNRFSLSNGYDLYRKVYDVNPYTLLLKNARQTGKTQTIANFISLKTIVKPFTKSFYLSPSQAQTTRFSHTKLMKVVNGSPAIKGFFSGKSVNNVFLKVADNGSEVTLGYASDDPDRIRGITSDDNYYDEIQDMDLVEVMTVADSCMDASLDPHKILSGTPKTVENPLEDMWVRSSQTEPLIYCSKCELYNKPTIKNIGLKGFICAKCGKILNVRNFKWRDTNNNPWRIKGFHIPQIVIPAHTENPKKWDILLEKFETWPRSKFNNEIMAESDSKGTRLLSMRDLEECCGQYRMAAYPSAAIKEGVDTIVAGVDWSGGGKDGISRTVVYVWGVRTDFVFKTLYYKIYDSEDPVASVEDVAAVCDRFGVRLVIGDQGEGSLANGMLAAKLGKHRVGKFRYGMFSKPVETDSVTGVFKLDKTTIIDNYFKFIKDKGVIFPDIVDSKPAFDDVMAEFSEVTHVGKKIWKHSMNRPDDCLHAMIGGWIAGKLLKRDLTFY